MNLLAFVMIVAAVGCREDAKEVPAEAAPPLEAKAPITDSSSAPAAPDMVVITGKILKIDRLPWKPGAMLTIDLVRVSLERGVDHETIASTTTDLPELPTTFTFPYDRSAIDEHERYALIASVHNADGKLIYGTDRRVPVLTYGTDSHNVHLVLKIAGLLPKRR